MSYSIALDGPAGAGKSTIAKMVSEKKGCFYVDTGAIYRAMALFMIRSGIGVQETDKIAEKCREADVKVIYEDGVQQVFLNGENVNGKIRTEEIGKMASAGAAVPAVREWLIDLQRNLAETNDVIMDGRDIGTCVLPEATVKIYLYGSFRKDTGSDIPSVHDDIICFCQIPLQIYQPLPDSRNSRTGRSHFPYLFCTNFSVYIFPI